MKSLHLEGGGVGYLESEPQKTLILKLHTDAGHGWLEVPKREVEALGVKLSHYSYQDKSNFYLEEDCDLTAFLRAYKNKFGDSPIIDLVPQVVGDHPIRSFARVG
jgi:hypothetical protein